MLPETSSSHQELTAYHKQHSNEFHFGQKERSSRKICTHYQITDWLNRSRRTPNLRKLRLRKRPPQERKHPHPPHNPLDVHRPYGSTPTPPPPLHIRRPILLHHPFNHHPHKIQPEPADILQIPTPKPQLPRHHRMNQPRREKNQPLHHEAISRPALLS